MGGGTGNSERRSTMLYVSFKKFNEDIFPYLKSIVRKEPEIDGNSIAYFFQIGGLTTTPEMNQIQITAIGCSPGVISKLEELAKDNQEDKDYGLRFIGGTEYNHRKYIKGTMKR